MCRKPGEVLLALSFVPLVVVNDKTNHKLAFAKAGIHKQASGERGLQVGLDPGAHTLFPASLPPSVAALVIRRWGSPQPLLTL